MKFKSLAKFAYLVADPDANDDPVIGSERIGSELGCNNLLNLVLSKVDAKSNPTSISTKWLKFLKENYFNLATTLNLYDYNSFKSNHFIFLYAFDDAADYGILADFACHISKKYGNAKFLPFSLSDETAARLVLLTQFKDFIMDLYSAKILSSSKLEKVKEYYPLLSADESVRLAKVVDFKTRNTKDLESLVDYCNRERSVILNVGWY